MRRSRQRPALPRADIWRAAALSVLSLCLVVPAARSCPLPAGGAEAIAAVLERTNGLRRKRGLSPLALSPELALAAQDQSCQMAETRQMGHDGPGGSTVGSRATTAGYTWRFIAENVAAGHPDAASVVAGWNRSRGHRRNMLSRDARDIGLGLAVRDGVPYWTMVVGARF